MSTRAPEYGLEFLLAFDGRVHHLEEGYWIKFEIERVKATKKRPHGLSYSFTLHAPDGTRLVGFDNAHGVPAKGSRFKPKPVASDHWHRTEDDAGQTVRVRDAETLIDDFFTKWNGCWVSRDRYNGRRSGRDTEVEMTKHKVQNLRTLREEMKAVARGERPAPADAGKPSFNSVDAMVRLLTPENRQLLALIRDRKPQSVAELVEMSGRAQPNLTRTLAKMEAAGFITMKAVGRRKAPTVAVKKIVVEIDPYSDRDRLKVA